MCCIICRDILEYILCNRKYIMTVLKTKMQQWTRVHCNTLKHTLSIELQTVCALYCSREGDNVLFA